MPALSSACASPRRVHGAKLPCYVFASNSALAQHVAAEVAKVIRDRNAEGKPAVLGLPTGSTPVGVYRELARLHRQEGLDFSNVITFNLDEYYGLKPDSLQSYHRWMHEQFFRHVNVRLQNIHIPDGTVPPEEIENYCRQYERQIAEAGGIDLMLLGIGGNGHIGFNEPFSTCSGRTRLCTLDPVTRKAAASDFFSEDAVPMQAITMGLATIMESRKILLLALGEHKAQIIREAAEGPVTERVPASILQNHPDAAFLLDEAAASALTGVATPWLIGGFQMTDAAIKRAVLWLCEQTTKALLKLNDDDFRQHNLHQLLRHHGPAQCIAQRVFRWMMDTISDHPAGEAEKTGRKRIICFSPHPDDDVISMGGTLIRLNEDGHEVHIAYMTSGNIAVFDHDARRIADLVTEYSRMFGIEDPRLLEVERSVDEALRGKQPGSPDAPAVLKIKGLIRWSEAKQGALHVGCREENLHFLDLPFYKTGTIAKKPVGQADIEILCGLIQRIRPDQIYMAGDLSDPHGTHRVCADAIFQALRRLEDGGMKIPEVLLYRGAWQEYPLHEIEIAVPLSPRDLTTKRMAIFMHESQKDTALFPGSDPREFWQRAEDRNKRTAASYNQIGLPEYFAMEAFVRWKGVPI